VIIIIPLLCVHSLITLMIGLKCLKSVTALTSEFVSLLRNYVVNCTVLVLLVIVLHCYTTRDKIWRCFYVLWFIFDPQIHARTHTRTRTHTAARSKLWIVLHNSKIEIACSKSHPWYVRIYAAVSFALVFFSKWRFCDGQIPPRWVLTNVYKTIFSRPEKGSPGRPCTLPQENCWNSEKRHMHVCMHVSM
jgi:hypothetical protein